MEKLYKGPFGRLPAPSTQHSALFLFLLLPLMACAPREGEIGGRDMDRNVREADVKIKESRTLSALGQMESSIADYYKLEKKVPEKLDTLVGSETSTMLSAMRSVSQTAA